MLENRKERRKREEKGEERRGKEEEKKEGFPKKNSEHVRERSLALALACPKKSEVKKNHRVVGSR